MAEPYNVNSTPQFPGPSNDLVEKRLQTFLQRVQSCFSHDETVAITTILNLVVLLHHDQKPRPDGLPYITHLLDVAERALDIMEPVDADIVVAALLHDAVEDQIQKLLQRATPAERLLTDERQIALAVILRLTGSQRVRDIVAGLTNPPFTDILQAQGITPDARLAYIEARNVLYVDHVRSAIQHPDVALVKFCDFSVNGLSIDEVPDAQKRARYLRKYFPLAQIFSNRLQDTQQPLAISADTRTRLLLQLRQAHARMQKQIDILVME